MGRILRAELGILLPKKNKNDQKKTVQSPSPTDRSFEQNFQTLASVLWGGTVKFFFPYRDFWGALRAAHQTLASVLWEGTQRRSMGGDFAVVIFWFVKFTKKLKKMSFLLFFYKKNKLAIGYLPLGELLDLEQDLSFINDNKYVHSWSCRWVQSGHIKIRL